MNTCLFRHVCQVGRCLVFLAFVMVSRSSFADKMAPGVNVAGTNEDFSPISAAVVQLLQSGNSSAFAEAVAPRLDDWKAIYSTNNVTHDPNPLNGFADDINRARETLKKSAEEFLGTAAALHLQFPKGSLRVRTAAPTWLGSTHYPTLQAPDDELRYANKVDVFIDLGEAPATNREFDIAVRGLLKFPGGWRSREGLQWVSFPPNVADKKTVLELSLKSKAAEYKGITDQDDPALRTLADALIKFLRNKDLSFYQREVLPSEETIWSEVQKSSGQHPSRKDLDQFWNEHDVDLTNAAHAVLEMPLNAEINFDDATIEVQSASIERLQSRGPWGGGPGGDGFAVKLRVTSNNKSKTGQNISGTYVLAAGQVSRFDDNWRILDQLRWAELPKGIIDTNARASMEIENYVAEHRSLPPGLTAPEINFTTLDSGRAMKLSDLRGKVVILDFWATWCGPCQAPMAELQSIRKSHPHWGNQVAIVPVSIDDTMDIVRKHLTAHGWTNTFNVWAGDGGWNSRTAKIFRVTGVPTTYVLDQRGVILREGYPDEGDITRYIDAALKKADF